MHLVLVDEPAVLEIVVVFPQRLTMIGREDDDRPLEKVQVGHAGDQPAEMIVEIPDFAVVASDVGIELCLPLVVLPAPGNAARRPGRS